jgi:predicted FMN-binding regulatory protein PaiB
MKNKIVWVSIKAEKFEGKFKISQNKDNKTIESIITNLKDHNIELSKFMENYYKNKE